MKLTKIKKLEKLQNENKNKNLGKVIRDNFSELKILLEIAEIIRDNKNLRNFILNNYEVSKKSYLFVGAWYTRSYGGFQGRRGDPYYYGLRINNYQDQKLDLELVETSSGQAVYYKDFLKCVLGYILNEMCEKKRISKKKSKFFWSHPENFEIIKKSFKTEWEEYCAQHGINPEEGFFYNRLKNRRLKR